MSCADRVFVRDVDAHCVGVGQPGRDGPGPLEVARSDHDAGTCLRRTPRHRLAQVLRPADHQDALPGQVREPPRNSARSTTSSPLRPRATTSRWRRWSAPGSSLRSRPR
jgi:hypothetical protein